MFSFFLSSDRAFNSFWFGWICISVFMLTVSVIATYMYTVQPGSVKLLSTTFWGLSFRLECEFMWGKMPSIQHPLPDYTTLVRWTVQDVINWLEMVSFFLPVLLMIFNSRWCVFLPTFFLVHIKWCCSILPGHLVALINKVTTTKFLCPVGASNPCTCTSSSTDGS